MRHTLKKTGAALAALIWILFFNLSFEAPPDSAQRYPGLSLNEVNDRTENLVRRFYKEASLKVDSLFSRTISSRHPGAAVAVVQDGHLIHCSGYGLANLSTREKIGPETSFMLASVTKQFTAMAVMMLEEEGKLAVTDSLPKYFDDIPGHWHPITIEHLLTHTSGLPDRFYMIGYGEGMTNEDILERLIEHRGLHFRPCSRFKYSNSGYNLLAMIVEKVSGVPFRDFLKQRIFDPLGMDDTAVYDYTKPEIDHRAVAYRPIGRGYYRSNDFLLWTTGASGIFSSAENLYKWDRALYTERLVSRETLDRIFAKHVKAGRTEWYGYGWRISEGDVTAIHHTGTLGGASNIIFRVPEKHFTVIMLTNRGYRARRWMVRRIADIYHPGLTDHIEF